MRRFVRGILFSAFCAVTGCADDADRPIVETVSAHGQTTQEQTNIFFEGRIAGEKNVQLQALKKTPEELVQDLSREPGPVLIIMSDVAHRSIGVRKTRADMVGTGLISHAFMEIGQDFQNLYDDFARDYLNGSLNSSFVERFRMNISQNPYYYYAPPEKYKELRNQYFKENDRIFTGSVENGVSVHFVDASESQDLTARDNDERAIYFYNRGLMFENAYKVLKKLHGSQGLDIQESIRPIRHEIVNMTRDYKEEDLDYTTEEDLVIIYNIAKFTLEKGFRRNRNFPEGWPEGGIDLETPLNFESILKEARAVLKIYDEETANAEHIRDEYRNVRIVDNITAIFSAVPDKEKFKGVLFIGQGHLDHDNDLDEMLKRALPSVRISRIDVIPTDARTVQRLGTQTAKGRYEGSDYVIFVPCPTVQYIVNLTPSPAKTPPGPKIAPEG